MYTDPEFDAGESLNGAPTTAVSPLIATETPNLSSVVPSEAVSLSIWIHSSANLMKMYAEPEPDPLSSFPGAPMMANSLLIETDSPKKSSDAASSGRIFSWSVHWLAVFV